MQDAARATAVARLEREHRRAHRRALAALEAQFTATLPDLGRRLTALAGRDDVSDALRAELSHMRHLLAAAAARARRVAEGDPEHLRAAHPFPAAVAHYVQHLTRNLRPTSLVDVGADVPERLPPAFARAILGLVAQGVALARTRAGCECIGVRLALADDALELHVDADGGAAPTASDARLRRRIAVAERWAALVGGRLEGSGPVRVLDRRVTVLRASVPLPARTGDRADGACDRAGAAA